MSFFSSSFDFSSEWLGSDCDIRQLPLSDKFDFTVVVGEIVDVVVFISYVLSIK